jgi:hypothetical protein
VIGAAKSGTTTLFHYLRGHPRIAMPAGKEVPFFSRDDRYSAGWDAFAAEQFASAPVDARWGKITPRYLGDHVVPARLAATMPSVKLLALLRNPVDRAFSKYRLLARGQRERRSFAEVVDDQLRPEALERSRVEPMSIVDSLVARGEYARLLDDYLRYFPREQLLIRLTDDFEADPQAVLDAVLVHIGLEPGWTPENLGRRYYVGGDRQRLPGLAPRAKKVKPVAALWRRLPLERRQALQLWFARQVNVVSDAPAELDPEVRARLTAFYRPDVERLEGLLGRPVPWQEFRGTARMQG